MLVQIEDLKKHDLIQCGELRRGHGLRREAGHAVGPPWPGTLFVPSLTLSVSLSVSLALSLSLSLSL